MQLPRLGKTAVIAAHAGDFAPDPFGEVRHVSYPIPVPGAEGLELAFLCCPWGREEEEGRRDLLAPVDVVRFDAQTTRFTELAPCSVMQWGLAVPDDRVLGRHWAAGRRNGEQLAAAEERLYQLYDELLPAFAAAVPIAPPLERAAAEFETVFVRVAEAPLAAWYQAIGRSFFMWVRDAARW